MRDNNFLKDRLDYIWGNFFGEIPRSNKVRISFGRRAKKRLGSIQIRKKNPLAVFSFLKKRKLEDFDTTKITITKYFQDLRVPLYVIDATIAHELCHYAHGFASPLPKLMPFPHRGGIIDKEMAKRGLGEALNAEKKWLDKEWFKLVKRIDRENR